MGRSKILPPLAAEPLFHNPERRKRGRPPGSKSKVLRDDRALGLHHFAFLRAGLLGVDLKKAFERYLAWGESTTDRRHAEHRQSELMKTVLDAGRQLDATLPAEQKITHLLVLLQAPLPQAALALPTLEEWVLTEGLDPDFYSEAELQAEYQAAFGLDQPDAAPVSATAFANTQQISSFQDGLAETARTDDQDAAADPVQARVKALIRLEPLLSKPPSISDKVEAWFAAAVARRLRLAGIQSLQDLAHQIHLRGHRWYTPVEGFGAGRAAKVVHWLLSCQEVLGLEIPAEALVPAQKLKLQRQIQSRAELGAGTELLMPPRFAITPLESLSCPPALSGADGVFRSSTPNTLGASNDLEAVNAWLQQYIERPATWRAYRKEAERFVLWCLHVRRKALSSITTPDCQAFRVWLADIPPSWINPMPVPRQAPMWRPFRGPLNSNSQGHALVIVQSLFAGLVDAGYLVANPMRAAIKGFNLPRTRAHANRTLNNIEWAYALRQAQAATDQAADAAKAMPRRLQLLLALLHATGLRLDELAQAKRRDLQRVAVDGEVYEAWLLTVLGKGRKPREIPVPDAVVTLIEAHAQDAISASQAVARGEVDNPVASLLTGDSPLVFGLTSSVPQWELKEQATETVAEQVCSRAEGSLEGLSASGIYRVLKRFMKRCANKAIKQKTVGINPEQLSAASTHWLRHGFARSAVVAGVPIEIVSQGMGHASLTTTSVYLTQERSRMIKELRKVGTK